MAEPASPEISTGFRAELLAAVREPGSGRLEAYSSGEHVGTVVVSRGRMVWATCRYQPEELGGFLRRLGHVTPEQLATASRTYQRHAGRRKLGGILEEAGIVSRPVLRRCLLLHIRMALACLMRNEALVGRWENREDAEPGEMSFALQEVFPELERASRPGAGGQEDDEIAAALEPLAAITGYRSSVVTDAWGAALAAHGKAAEDPLEASLVATAAAGLAESGAHVARGAGLGRPAILLVEGAAGSLAVRWLDLDRRLLVALRLEEDGRTGVARHRLETCADVLAGLLATRPDEQE